jgi:hypothetical protein
MVDSVLLTTRFGAANRIFQLSAFQISAFSSSVLLAAAIERLYDLNVGTTPLAEGGWIKFWQICCLSEQYPKPH